MRKQVKKNSKNIYLNFAIFPFFLAITGTCFLISCKQPKDFSNSVNTSGNCTYQYIDDYNDVVTNTKSLIAANQESPRNETALWEISFKLKQSCGVYKEQHNGVSCKALNITTNQVVMLDTESLQKNCDQNSKALETKKSTKVFPPSIFDGTEKLDYVDFIEN